MINLLLIILSSAVIALLTVLYLMLRYRMTYWHRRGIPHDKPYFLFGNLRGAMVNKYLSDIIRESYNKFRGTGPFAGFYMLCNPAVMVLDLELAQQVLIKDFHNFSNRVMFYNERDDPLTANIFSLPATEWRQLRQKITPAFSTAKLRAMFPTIVQIGETFFEAINTQINDGDTNVLEMKEFCNRYTTDVISNCIFGLECSSLKDPTTILRTMNQNLFEKPRNHRAVDGFIYALPRLARWLRLCQIPDVTSQFYYRIVSETLELREREKACGIYRNDLIEKFLELKQTGELTMNEIVANAFIFYVAGYESSATTMTLTLYELAKAPAYQERARAEILRAVEQYDGKLCYEAAQEMRFLEQIIMETMRLHTMLPQIQREATEDFQTSDPRYFIEKGTLILIPIEGIHHDPEIYPEPYEYRPERFAPDEINARHPMSWLGFGEGPRNCLGLCLAKMQMRIGLATLLRNFRFSLATESPESVEFYLQYPVNVPKPNIYLSVQRINDAKS